MSIFTWLFSLLSIWWVWLPIVLALLYLTYQNNRRIKHIDTLEHTLLILEIPRANDKKELAAEQMFASLHGILRTKKELMTEGGMQEHISLEIASIDKKIYFYVWTPKHLQSFVEGQIYAQYPTVQIYEAPEDYAERDLSKRVFYSTDLVLNNSEALPIKTFQSFEVDPLAAITATLAKLEYSDEELWVQVLARPVADTWHNKTSNYIKRVKNGGSLDFGGIFSTLIDFVKALNAPPEPGAKNGPELSERDRTRISEAEKKSSKLGYQVKIRLAYIGNDERTAKLRIQAMVGSFKQFNSTNLNGFKQGAVKIGPEALAAYKARFFIEKGFILNIEELASLFHLPHTSVETPSIVWASAKTAEPPSKLPALIGDATHDNEISAFGMTNFRGNNQQFGLYRSDRGRHVYVIGQTGVGKSKLMELFALSDLFHNQGYAIIDPHGDFAINNLMFVPPSRIKDVVYFNPADTEFPMSFNPLEVTNPALKNHISSELVGVMKRMFGESWGPRLEYILRNTILALLDYPNSTMLDITRMLTEKKFRNAVIEKITDPVVRAFWVNEFASWNEKFASEAIAPVLNKVGAFTANPLVRNIVGQPKSSFNLRKVMDEGKIFIANLSRGLLGEDNAATLGALLVTKIQLAAMSRADLADIDDRRPFYLYVDEFQNFATDSFAVILSEARKYGLNLTVANQYIGQMPLTVRDAVFGNVGTIISFRVSPDDANVLSRQFQPQFEPQDIMQLHNQSFIISMVIKGEKTQAFSATTLRVPQTQQNYLAEIIEHSRKIYAKDKGHVEKTIHDIAAGTFGAPPKSATAPQWQPATWSAAEAEKQAARSAQKSQPSSPKTTEQKPPAPAPEPVNQTAPAKSPQTSPKPPAAPQAPSTTQEAQPQSASAKRRRRRRRSRSGGQGGGGAQSEGSAGSTSSSGSSSPTRPAQSHDATELRLR